jgi:1-acyl-sn-glycerol-3-phosphate acyltransferase
VKEASTERLLIWKSLQAIARILTTVLFDLKVYGRQNVPRRGGVLIVSNHQGYLDAVVLAVRLDRPLNYLAKSELFESRWFSWLLRMLNAFPVRLGHRDVAAVRETIRRLQEGHVLNFYPEGTRTPDGQIKHLEKGVALIVRRAAVPVVPAVIVGSFEAWPAHRKMFRPWPVRVQFGPPMDLAELGEKEIVARIDRTLRAMFQELREREGMEGRRDGKTFRLRSAQDNGETEWGKRDVGTAAKSEPLKTQN